MKKLPILCLLSFLIFFSCKKDKPFQQNQHPSTEKTITSFSFLQKDNPGLPQDITGAISQDTIRFTIPESWPIHLLPHIIVSSKAIVGGGAIEAKDFSQPVHITIVAEDNSTKEYVIIVTRVLPPSLPQLFINNAACPYDSTSNTFYYPVSIGSDLKNYSINFDTLSAKTLNIRSHKYSNGSTVDILLKTNDTLNIWADNGFKTKQYSLLITGLPLVKLVANQYVGEDYEAATFSLIDPDYKNKGTAHYMTISSTIKVRGATARTFPKKSMALKTKDGQGEDMDTSILGLRSDQNWILDAMWVDKAKMRNRLSTDIWNTMNNVPYASQEPKALNGTRGYLVELFFNNEYHGIYTLTEKLDRKQLKIKKKSGFSYKANQWGPAVQFTGVPYNYNNNSENWANWELSYPDDNDDYPMNWKYLYDFVKFVSTSTDTEFKNNIDQYVDIDNIIDYLLFENAVCGEDNTAKNTFLSIYDTTKSKKMFYSVWDLDGSMGRDWKSDKYQDGNFMFMTIEDAHPNNLYKRLISLNPNNFIGKLKTRWNQLKANQLSPAAVTAQIFHYRNQLEQSNVYTREKKKWANEPLQAFGSEANYMSSWYAAHFAALDNYIQNL